MPARYALAPAARMLWRAPDKVQFELGSRAVVLDGISGRTARSLTTPSEQPDPEALPALAQLAELGMVWPRTDGTLAAPNPHLAAEVAALSTRLGPSAATAVHARRTARVAVHGTGRAGAHIGALLAASGVGHVHFLATTDVRIGQAIPGGVRPGDESQRLATASRAAVQRAAPGTDVSTPGDGTPPDLIVLAVDEPLDDDRREGLRASGIAHLQVALSAAHAVVGPLVLPGLTSCLTCAELHRCDRDADWPRLAVQLGVTQRYGPASESTVATIAAGVAAMQALAFLDGAEPACLDGTIELHPPDWRLRRRTWPVHPDCECRSAQ